MSEALYSLDDGLAEPSVEHFALGRHLEHDREREFVASRVERAQFFAQRRREHRHGALNEVDGRRTFASLSIERRVGLGADERERFTSQDGRVGQNKNKKMDEVECACLTLTK